MTPRDRTVVVAILGLLIVAAGWFLLLSPVRKDGAALDGRVAAAQARTTAAGALVGSGESAKAAYRSDYAAVSRLGKAVPADDDVPSLLVQLQGAADRSRVDFRSIALSTDAGAAATAPSQAAAIGAASSGTTGATGAADAAPASGAAVPATQASASTLPPGAIVGAAGFPTMPFDFTFAGSFFRLKDFMARLDRFTEVDGSHITVRGRLLTVDGFALSPGPKGFPSMVASVHATAYLLPPGSQESAASAAGTATAAAVPDAASSAPASLTPGGSTR